MRSMHIAMLMAAFALTAFPALAQEETPKSTEFDKTHIKDRDRADAFDENKSEADEEMDEASLETQRHEILTMAKGAMDELFETSARAHELYEDAHGYAVFNVVKVAVGITGGGGEGVAIAKQNMNDPIFMDMATGGIGIGLGGQKYKTIFLFRDKTAFEDFVYDGWSADAEANAAAGTAGANTAASFTKGVVIYQLTDKGLLANVDVSGTKYWVDEDLNRREKLDELELEDRERTD